jgi:hypothetical protein
MGTTTRTSSLYVGYQDPGGVGLQVRRMRVWGREVVEEDTAGF